MISGTVSRKTDTAGAMQFTIANWVQSLYKILSKKISLLQFHFLTFQKICFENLHVYYTYSEFTLYT